MSDSGLIKRISSKNSKKNNKPNLQKLCSEMNKLTTDAVDREIIKRFRIIIDSSPEDLSKNILNAILDGHKEIDISSHSESLQPYIKHYLFMLKRKKNHED